MISLTHQFTILETTVTVRCVFIIFGGHFQDHLLNKSLKVRPQQGRTALGQPRIFLSPLLLHPKIAAQCRRAKTAVACPQNTLMTTITGLKYPSDRFLCDWFRPTGTRTDYCAMGGLLQYQRVNNILRTFVTCTGAVSRQSQSVNS